MIAEEKSSEEPISVTKKVNGSFNIQNHILNTNQKTSLSKSVFRTANILTCLSRGIGSVTDIAGICNINKSTIHRILGALCEAKLAMQDPSTKQYYLGSLISEIAVNPIITHESLIICATNEMRALARYTGETIGLAGLIGFQQLSLHEVPSIHDFRIVVQKKFTEHMHAGATSRILLAQLNSKDLKVVMANMDFKSLTENTITYKEQWLAHLKQAKEQGYAVSYGERILGGMCISVPINNYKFPVALDIAGPEARMKPKVNEFLNEVKATADRIQQNLARTHQIK